VYEGNPIMDLLQGRDQKDVPIVPPNFPDAGTAPKIVLLPGSRERAYDDVKLLLDAVEILQARRKSQAQKACDYVMVVASTLSLPRVAEACEGWKFEEENGNTLSKGAALSKGDVLIHLRGGDVSAAAAGAHLLIGLGGTANQLCAGMGIPVVSIDEKGKRVQKKLLEDAEILVEPVPSRLADCALEILTDRTLYEKMSLAGTTRMGAPGALDSVVRYAAEELGWRARCEVYGRLCAAFSRTSPVADSVKRA
jgi:tetraacyldisaccharide 4'-kinase